MFIIDTRDVSTFLHAIFVLLSQAVVALTQWVTMIPSETRDITAVGLSEIFGVH